MSKTLVGIGICAALIAVSGGLAAATDTPITTRSVQIRDRAPDRRSIQIKSRDAAITRASVDPVAHGATLHVFSATDDLCFGLYSGWADKRGRRWKYKDANKNTALVKDKYLSIRLKRPAPLGYSLDEPTQGAVTAIFESGSQRYCMVCSAPVVDSPGKYVAKRCAVAACPTEPSLCPRQLAFTATVGTGNCGGPGLTTPPAAPFSGELDSDVAGTTKIVDLGLGCVYSGGGLATLFAGRKMPDGARAVFGMASACTCSAGDTPLVPTSAGEVGDRHCTAGPGPNRHCINGSAGTGGGACATDSDCGGVDGSCALDTNCYLGPPVPVVVLPPLAANTTCGINRVIGDASGTVNCATGSMSILLPTAKSVYITGNTASPCPKCLSGTCDPTWKTNTAQPSPDAGQPCTTETSALTSHDCRPYLPAFQATVRIDTATGTTDTTTLTSASGVFCPSQNSAGAFGQTAAQRITETGVPANACLASGPQALTIAHVLCVPGTGNAAVDGTSDLPGPAGFSVAATVEATQ